MVNLALVLAVLDRDWEVDLPFLSPMFGDHMVMQRDKPNTFWGWTTPHDTVTLSVGGKSFETRAEASGAWSVKVTPPPVGGPYSVKVVGEETVELADVLVGDVWICSGQSNMEQGMMMTDGAEADVKSAEKPTIRLYMAGKQVGVTPMSVNSGEWKVCSPASLVDGGWGGFSGVGYHFGRRLNEELKVPVGLVQAAWGGTSAEAWTGTEAIKRLGDWNQELEVLEAMGAAGKTFNGSYVDLWMAEHDRLAGLKLWEVGATFDGWKDVTVPSGFGELMETQGAGVAWFRKEFEVGEVGEGEATLHLGSVRTADSVWLNGVLIGTGGWDGPRVYPFWRGHLKAGTNILVMRVMSPNGPGGLMGQPDGYFLRLGEERTVSLSGSWQGALGAAITAETPRPRSTEPLPTVPTVLMNGMIRPIAPLAVRGVIWYQGETNAGRGWQYRSLLPAMIGDWRRLFGQGDFPFYIVSLANFGQRSTLPVEDGWAELREAQALTAKNLANSGLATTVDVGDAGDIHPRDKKSVGERLALVALAKEYGREGVVYSGPEYRAMRVVGSRVRLSFNHLGGGLVAREGGLKGFAIAGADRNWVWAEARIEGDEVEVWAEGVGSPVAVRYGWAMNPEATLFNRAGLPAHPFRTDDWPTWSRGNK